VSPGFGVYPYATIRVADINSPELHRGDDAERAAGVEARAYAMSLAPVGTPVVIHTEPDTETFGRFVAAITLPDGRDFGQAMVAAGHAVVMER
jgi:endonuclease YncB( thermonuclease family)